MLKTDVEHPARPASFLIALGVLRAYIRNALGFLAGTVLTLPRFKRRLPRDLPKEFVEVVALQTWFCMRLKARGGKERALWIIRSVVLSAGLAIQQANLRAVEAPRTFASLISHELHINKEGPTRWNRLEICEQGDRKFEFRVLNCMLRDFFTRMGVPELTTLHSVLSTMPCSIATCPTKSLFIATASGTGSPIVRRRVSSSWSTTERRSSRQ